MLSRIRLMLQDKVELLKGKCIAIFGVGGVGGYTLEALIRSGIENIDIYDFDIIDISNINRQVIANTETVGNNKVEEWVKRAKLINPNINIYGYNMFVDVTVSIASTTKLYLLKSIVDILLSSTNILYP